MRALRVLLSVSILAFAQTAGAATTTYTFRDTLNAADGSSPLEATFNNGTFVGGTYVDTTIDANACPNTPTVRGYSFPAYGGLKAQPTVAGESYTISMIAKFSPLKSGYTRLVDFSDSTLDDGIYVLDGKISFYPVGTYADGSFADNRFSVMTLTRDATTNVVSLFIGTTPAGTYEDTGKKYVPSAGNLIFFMDNTTGAAAKYETSPGVVTFVRVVDKAITAAEVAKTIDEACGAVACGNGRVEGNEGCDDHGNVDGDGCSKDCKVENGYLCADGMDAGDAGALGAASCASANCGAVSHRCIPAGGCYVDDECTSKSCNTPTFTCNAIVPDAAAPSDAGAAADSGPYLPDYDSGAPNYKLPPLGTSDSDCHCGVGPLRTGGAAMGLVLAALGMLIVRRRRR